MTGYSIISGDFLINVLLSEEYQTFCYIIIILLSSADLILLYVNGSRRCQEIVSAGHTCVMGPGLSVVTAGLIVAFAVSALMLHRRLRCRK
ncbi:MAG: hypothetical protein LUQ35_08440 [Methanoregula sp.]|jgi:hypothetical protein|nr:hypothetical protein [Methanoregula sp.]